MELMPYHYYPGMPGAVQTPSGGWDYSGVDPVALGWEMPDGGGAGSPDGFYGDGVVGGGNGGYQLVNFPVWVLTLAALVAKYGRTVGTAVYKVLYRVTGHKPSFGGGPVKFLRTQWTQLPWWCRWILGAMGFKQGMDFIFGGDEDDPAEIENAPDNPTIPGLPADGAGALMIPGQGGMIPSLEAPYVVGSWVANGVTFYRLWDGRIAVQNQKGRWKVWKPKKPVVLYPGGAGNLRTLLRADRIAAAQLKRLNKAIIRRKRKGVI